MCIPLPQTGAMPMLEYSYFAQKNRKERSMTSLLDKLILFVGCGLFMYFGCHPAGSLFVFLLLTSVTFVCLCSYCNLDCLKFEQLSFHTRLFLAGLWLSLAALSLFSPGFGCFLPLLFYELAISCRHAFPFAACLLPFLSFRKEPDFYLQAALLLFCIAWIFARKTTKLLSLEREFRLLRDSSREYHLLLQQKNKNLIEKQNHEIHIATLKERNRIAREIHDNVGHMLSRSLLQAGALSAVNQQENLQEPLNDLKHTLSLAMTSVRESVHGLHDDSIDLKATVSELVSEFSNYSVSLDYDMGSFIPSAVKYCFISIVKEGLSNIARHSSGTEISIVLREHPSLYQLMIKDNGTNAKAAHWGMGISNMKERVKSLDGNFSISTEQGFQIFVSLPHK